MQDYLETEIKKEKVVINENKKNRSNLSVIFKK